jgi:putative DNA primase/helicase
LTGNGGIQAQEKYQKSFSFVPYTKLLFATNKIPKANDEVDAYYERWILVNFPNQFIGEKRDNQIYEKITTKEELEGLLKKCLDILPNLLKNNFSYPLTVEERKTLYIKLSDTAGQFLAEKVELDTSVATTKEELYQAFVAFCRESKQPIMSEKSFARTIYAAYPKVEEARLRKPATSERARSWLGLRYIGNEDISFTPNM